MATAIKTLGRNAQLVEHLTKALDMTVYAESDAMSIRKALGAIKSLTDSYMAFAGGFIPDEA